jgi:flagellar assembly factor FliW
MQPEEESDKNVLLN